jgi:hypothetical protein
MDTKSEDGDPGSDEDTSTPLSSDEQAMLEKLRSAGVSAPADDPEAGTTLPGAPPPVTAPDPLDPVFREPGSQDG